MKAVVLFITISVVTGINGQTPKPCCFPDQFSADIMQMKTATQPEMVYIRTNLDYKLQKQAAVTYYYNPETKEKTKVAKILFDFSMGKTYIVTGEHEENCREMPLKQPMYSNCLEGMTFVGSSYLGPPSAQLAVNTWTTRNNVFNITITVTENGCVPVTQTQVGEMNGFHTDDMLMYENYVPDKVDKGAFDLPPSCKKDDLVFQPTV